MANKSNKLVVPGAQAAIDNMKAEIASELGVTLGADTSASGNASCGGGMKIRLVEIAQQQIGSTK